MKLLIFITCFIIATRASCIPDHGNGRPSCINDMSVGKTHRNHWDPTAYWVCQQKNQAISLRCPAGLLFSVEAEKCVNAHEWNWTPSCLEIEVSEEIEKETEQ